MLTTKKRKKRHRPGSLIGYAALVDNAQAAAAWELRSARVARVACKGGGDAMMSEST